MQFQTSRFGRIDYPEDVALRFPDGILGFEDDVRFILLEHDADGSPFRWLQSLVHPDLAFLVVDPSLIDPSYHVAIDRDTAAVIGGDDPDACAFLSIVNVPPEAPIRMSANLKAPIIIHADHRIGRQVILGSNGYLLSAPVFPAINDQLARLTHEAPDQHAVSSG